MSFTSYFSNTHLCQSAHNLLFLHTNSFQIREFRVWRRRRLKTHRKSAIIRNQFGPFAPSSFESLLSHLPSVNSLDLIAPALGFASGVALYLSRLKPATNSEMCDVGEWIFFTSPTPFNRFVLLRCPSISFEGSELLEDVNEKLVKEERHFVRLKSGRIYARDNDVDGRRESEDDLANRLAYQRKCVLTEDGGVISLDWPANLDLTEEHGLDTTVLLIPGTPEGSMDKKIRSFVCECLKRGFFPVVMNPRGCAGSPLTTARLFTAADSDDICTAIQFINKARPWTTLMGVGWGYGANMLIKYLAEVGEKTPLTAATCIDNPFDLEEATRSSPHHIAIDQKLTGGLIDILRSNKELFQGRTKGFDVEKALLAKSVCDFEKAISMVSYGFDAIEDFYSKASTRGVVGNVKIPVLFIQNDDGTVPLFSIPRSLIAENPFTSLLLCSCLSSVIVSDSSVISWCQHLTIEWLTAVELGLLKGRHPLLKDVDVTINPSKGLALVEGKASNKGGRVNKLLDLTLSNSVNEYSVDPINEMLEEDDTAAGIQLRSRHLEDKGLQQVGNGAVHQTNSVDAELVKEDGVSPVDNESGEVLQTTQVVMNMLDVTMPDTLTDEQKKKVLTAVGRGETLMKALQDAVPEDVRGKLTTAVSEILHTQGTKLNFDRFLHIGRIPSVSSGLNSDIQEKVGGLLSEEGLRKDPHSSDQTKRLDDLADGMDNSQPAMDQPAEGLESELPTPDRLEKSVGLGQSQSTSNHGGDISSSVRMGSNESGNNNDNSDFSEEKAAQCFDYNENGSETRADPNFPSESEKAGGTDEAIVDQDGAQLDAKEQNNIKKTEENTLDSSADQNKMTSSTETEEAQSPLESSSGAQPESNDNQKREDKSVQPVLDENKSILSDSSPNTFSVSHALDALTGMDETTQVAVQSVFGVIEDMITHLEEEKDNENEVNGRNEVKSEETGSVSEKHPTTNDHKLEKKEDSENDLSLQSDVLHSSTYNCENHTESHIEAKTRWMEVKPMQNPISFYDNGINLSQGNNAASLVGKRKNEKKFSSKLLAKTWDRRRHLNNIPLHVSINPYGDSLYNEYLRRYLLSKMPNTKSLDLDTTTALLLDYFPEDGQWKLLEQPGNIGESNDDTSANKGVNRKVHPHSPATANDTDKIIEPAYVILDTEKLQEPVREYEITDKMNEKVEIENDRIEELAQFVKNIILDSLKVEIGRRLSTADMKEMESSVGRELEQIANAVSLAVRHDKEHIWHLEGKGNSNGHTSEKGGALHGEHIIRAISIAVQDTSYLRRILPVGVIVGSSLAALRKFFDVATVHDSGQRKTMTLDQVTMPPDQVRNSGQKIHGHVSEMEISQMPSDKANQRSKLDASISKDGEKGELKNMNNETVIVGAVTAALGASALLMHQQDPYQGDEIAGSVSKSFKEKGNHLEPGKLEEAMSEKDQNNIVTSLADKAMSVAGPVVPTKENGGVDQERLVAMLAELGQRGGMLKLVGKVALLWGGLRGAMSLTDRLISFLHLAERPLFQRILAFVCMVLVLWAPVVVPLLPTLMRSWATHNSSRIAQFACIVGLYTAVVILVMLWGKRIRGYEYPLEQYGLDFTPPKIQNFLKAFIGGVMLVLSIQSVNALLGCVSVSWPSSLASSPLDAVTWLKVYGKMLMLAGRGIVTATAVAFVEELLFRSWLPEEIGTDLGYYRGIIISGLTFSFLQGSPQAIPGLWLLSLGLAGARQRNQGSLSIPIGFRAGIMATNFFLQMGGFLTYQPNISLWVTGTRPFQPFSGIVGLVFSSLLAIVLYPRQPLHRKKTKRTICE